MNVKLKVETVECAVKDVSTTQGRCENAHSAFVGGPNVAKVDTGGAMAAIRRCSSAEMAALGDGTYCHHTSPSHRCQDSQSTQHGG